MHKTSRHRSPTVLYEHDRGIKRFVLHVDLDQFLVAVEVLRQPELAGRPVIVGGIGDPTRRGVVSTASYEARRFGINSGTPLRTAARRCPAAVFLPLDLPAYRRVSAQVMAVLRTLSAEVEVAGWDEAYLAATTARPEALARRIQQKVLEHTRLHCSVGVGENRLQAKIASGLAKPAGVFRLTGQNWRAVMAARPADDLVGVGPKRSRRLAGLGIRTVADLARANREELAEEFGHVTGPSLIQLARGIGSSAVSPQARAPVSRGKQLTFQRDISDPAAVRREVRRLADKLAVELEGAGARAEDVEVTVRFVPFETHSHVSRLPVPAFGRKAIENAAAEALSRFTIDRPVRLLGVRTRLAHGVGSGRRSA